MNKLLLKSIFLVLFISMPLFAADVTVVGFWKTIDDHSKRPRSIVKIFEKENKVFGKIVKIYPHKGNPGFLCFGEVKLGSA